MEWNGCGPKESRVEKCEAENKEKMKMTRMRTWTKRWSRSRAVEVVDVDIVLRGV